ncbi:MAG: hypothetical protein R3343_13255 [Nitriliruptorales bacterium]|nr:hypothetical protein [Nitriliruptorales bacterium]
MAFSDVRRAASGAVASLESERPFSIATPATSFAELLNGGTPFEVTTAILDHGYNVAEALDVTFEEEFTFQSGVLRIARGTQLQSSEELRQELVAAGEDIPASRVLPTTTTHLALRWVAMDDHSVWQLLP